MLSTLLTIVVFYLIAGSLFALLFVFRLVDQFDEQARGAPISFRLIILPAAILLWPFLVYRLLTKKNKL